MVNGYSIVTYQRALKAQDALDLPILINEHQAIAWAIGPLNHFLEVSKHDAYTHGNKLIHFGRQPQWNCPMPEMKMTPDDEDEIDGYPEGGPAPVAAPMRGSQNNKRRDEDRFPQDLSRPHSNDRNSRPPAQQQQQQQYNQQQQPQQQQHPEGNRRGPQTQIAHRNDENSNKLNSRRPVPTPKPATTNGAWEITPIPCYEPEDGIFFAQMGPTGGKQGYRAITG